MRILGVRIDNFSREEILEKIGFFLTEEKFHHICTVNPEFILAAQESEEFKNILNSSALNVADGVGVWYAFLRHFTWLKTRIAGADLLYEILSLAQQKEIPVFLAISNNSLSDLEEIKKALLEQYPDLKIGGEEIDKENFSTYSMPDTGCRILLCNFGAPAQEKFINLVKNDTIRLAMGVGGAFDFATGKRTRAPKLMRILGLEWLWRLAQEPRYRAKRIWKAFPVFAWRVLINR